jgi:hypothetical protein
MRLFFGKPLRSLKERKIFVGTFREVGEIFFARERFVRVS